MGLYIPDEILQHIMRYFLSKEPRRLSSLKYPYDDGGFDPSSRPTDLHSLCLVSRRFCDIAQPLLYHTINITDETIDTDGPGQQLEWPGRLLKTMAENPHLAKHIRVLAIQSTHPEQYGRPTSLGTFHNLCDAFWKMRSNALAPMKYPLRFYFTQL
uniref:F-box domain-containing protein n=1 Tax=Bionectria ochroleuca TaxID=29856 RepID=A0A8H7K1S7_BIOOC